MKKQHYLIIALIISLLFGAYNFLSLKSQKQTANNVFISNIQIVPSCFGRNYNELNNDEKNDLNTEAVSNLHTAIYVLRLSSYGHNENQDQLLMAINELYYCLKEINTTNSRSKAFTEKAELINKYLKNISDDPNDISSCEALYKLSYNLYNNYKDVVIKYKATSQNWDIDYKIDGNEGKHETYYSFKYIGKDAGLVKEVNYSIDSTNEGEDGKFTMTSTKVYTGKLKLTVGLPKPTDRDITFKIKWNGKMELLILKRSK